MTPAPPLPTRVRSLLPLLAGVGILGAILAAWLHRPVTPGVWHDDAVYLLLLGEALAEGRGYVYAGVPGDPPAAKFPPGYPLLLAVLGWGANGEVLRVAWLAALVNLVAVVATALALVCLGVRRLGFPPAWAAGAGVAYLLLVDPWLFALPALSESLAILAMVLAVDRAAALEGSGVAGSRGGGSAPESRWWEWRMVAVPVILFAVAVHLRSAALPLGLALVLAALMGGGRRRAGAVGVAVVAVAGPWLVASALRTRRIPAVFRDILGGYGDWIRPALADPGGFLAARVADGGRMAGLLGEVLLPWSGDAPLRWTGLALAAVLAGAGLHGGWKHSRTAVLLTAGLALQLLLWPWGGRRMLLPLLPWLVLAVTLGLRRWAAALRPGIPSGAVVLLGGLWMGGLAATLGRAGTGPDGIAAPVRPREATLSAAVAAVRDWVPPGRTVGAPELWAALHLQNGHPVVPSAPFRADARGIDRAGPPEDQLRLWAVADFSAVVAEGGIHDRALELLEARCGPEAFTVPAAGPGFRLVLLRWDEDCRRGVVPGWGGRTAP